VDRVDRDREGLHVLDYKTGSLYGFTPASAVFHGGRRLQHVIYAEVAERLLGEEVADVAYVFPTARGQNEERRFTRDEVRPGLELLDVMLDQVASGRLLPTNDKDDCGICDFRSVCRVSDGDWKLTSPMAEWGERNMLLLAEYAGLRRIRGWEEGT
jgi:RecB family exonuclease